MYVLCVAVHRQKKKNLSYRSSGLSAARPGKTAAANMVSETFSVHNIHVHIILHRIFIQLSSTTLL